MLSPQQVRGLSLPPSPGSGDENLGQADGERYSYRVMQWMGRCIGNHLPAVHDFELVQCNDLSANGVSFYADDVQIGQRVVIAIGSGNEHTFLMADAMHRRIVSVNDRFTYLVDCRFRRRLSADSDAEMLGQYQEHLLRDREEVLAL